MTTTLALPSLSPTSHFLRYSIFISAASNSPRKFFLTLFWRAGYDSLLWKTKRPGAAGALLQEAGGQSV